MLDKPYYLTTGVQKLPFELVEVMLELIKGFNQSVVEKDYLQVFHLYVNGDTVHIAHKQEVPEYMRIERIQFELPFRKTKDRYTIFVIDNGDYATMMLAEEY